MYCAKEFLSNSIALYCYLGAQHIKYGQSSHPFPHHHWENFLTKIKWMIHWLTINHACPIWTYTLITHSNTQHTLITRSRVDQTLVMYSCTHHKPTIHSHIDIHWLYTYASRTYRILIYSPLNHNAITQWWRIHHSLVIYSSLTTLTPHARTHTHTTNS